MAKILVVDDEPDIREIIEAILTCAHHDVHFAENGVDGLARFRAARLSGEPFDLVLTDMMMHGMTGCEFANQIRREGDYETPILLLTTHGHDLKTIDCARRLGYERPMTKPDDVLRLPMHVFEALHARTTSA